MLWTSNKDDKMCLLRYIFLCLFILSKIRYCNNPYQNMPPFPSQSLPFPFFHLSLFIPVDFCPEQFQNILISMPKQVIVNMQGGYPFGECEQGDDQSVRILVRRSIDCPPANREATLTRAHFFRRLNQSCIIRLQQVLEQQSGVTLMYEYVPIRMQTWISNINQKFIESFCRQLVELGEYLAKCYISAEIRLENVGMDENYRPKYFLDLDFAVDESIPKSTLRTKYQQEVLQLFKPYVQSKLALKPVFSAQQPRGSKESSSSHREEYSPGTIVKYRAPSSKVDKSDLQSVASTLRLREKAVALQKERKNESINVCGSQFQLIPYQKNRKQSILSSVSNVKIKRLGTKIDEIKSKLRNIYSPQPFYIRHQQKSIQKRDNGIAFNYGSTQKVFTNGSNPKIKGLDSSSFCQNILRDLQQEQSMFQKFEKNLAKQICGGMPLKKNETLKEKEYEQMKKSDDGYFKDFFMVLEDKPKQLMGEDRPLMIDNAPFQAQQPRQAPSRAVQKPHMLELENRVKSAINKSKTLINKFKGQR